MPLQQLTFINMQKLISPPESETAESHTHNNNNNNNNVLNNK